MCAIAGILAMASGRPDPAVLDRMLDVQQHRGPDDEGRYVDGPVALGHRRLSIIDLSPSGHQPMATEDRTLWIVFNGEVFNYVELRAELAALGHRFQSHSDTEVVLHAYQEWGAGCLERFNGMFAFAVWDPIRRRLFCARDRLGVKPFYYHCGEGRFVFASEMKALFADSSVSRDPDPRALTRFLVHELQDDEYGTSFRDVQQLPPGHWLSIDPDRGDAPNPTCWWSLPSEDLGEVPRREEAAEQVRHLFEDAVRLRLRSDVPVGTCLSGGLDSSSIVCTAAGLLSRADPAARIRVFSARSDDPRIDEGRYIDEVVRATGAEAHAVFPTGVDFVDGLERVVWHQEEPFHAPSVFAQYQVMRLARETGVTVLLDGQAGDEIFAGYYYFVPPYLADLLLRGRWSRLAAEWRAHAALHGVALSAIGRDVARAVIPEGAARIVGSAINGRRAVAETSYLGPILAGLATRRRPMPSTGRDRLHAALRYATLRSPLPNYLHHEDRNSMAWSIEARTPFLDYRLVEYVTRLPGQYKIDSGWTKAVLRDAMKGLLPEPVRLRADKQGFSTPHREWFRGEARDLLRDLLVGEPATKRGWVDRGWARRTAEDLVEGRPFDLGIAWRCACLELWARVMLDRPVHMLLEPRSVVDRPRAAHPMPRAGTT